MTRLIGKGEVRKNRGGSASLRVETVIFAALAEQTWQADPKRMTVMTDRFAGRGNIVAGELEPDSNWNDEARKVSGGSGKFRGK
jgi:hypothetical protein